MSDDRLKRTYAVEIEFDTPIDFAEQDRLACVVLERLVDEWWENAQAGTGQGNMPMKVTAYPIPTPGYKRPSRASSGERQDG